MSNFPTAFASPGGRAARTRTTKDFQVMESLYPPGLKQARHPHLLASFSFVYSGKYKERFLSKTSSREVATVVFHPPQESHAVEFESAVRILSFHFSFDKLASIREQYSVLDTPSGCRSAKISMLGVSLVEELRRNDSASNVALEGLAMEILAEGSRNETVHAASPQWLKEVKAYLHDNFSESFALTEVAKVVGVHPAHLSRVFRERLHCTVGDYIRGLRLEHACRQIATTNLPLAQIAIDAGFSDQSHFNRAFRGAFKLTPYQYRKLSRSS